VWLQCALSPDVLISQPATSSDSSIHAEAMAAFAWHALRHDVVSTATDNKNVSLTLLQQILKTLVSTVYVPG
jgi:hypothetical protein